MIFWIPISILMPKAIFIKYLPPVQPKLVPKLKVLRIYWNLLHSTFQICQSQLWCQIGPKIRNAQDFLKFDTFDISNMPISILMSNIIFYQIFTNSWAQIDPKIWNAQNLLNFDKNWNLIKIFDKNYFWH